MLCRVLIDIVKQQGVEGPAIGKEMKVLDAADVGLVRVGHQERLFVRIVRFCPQCDRVCHLRVPHHSPGRDQLSGRSLREDWHSKFDLIFGSHILQN